MSGFKHSDRARSALLASLVLGWAAPAAAQATLSPEAQMIARPQEYAVIGRETIPIPLLSTGGNQASVTQTGQSNALTLEQLGRSTVTAQQIGSGNIAGAALRGDQGALSLFQSGIGNTSAVTAGGSSGISVQQIGNNNRSDISLTAQGTTASSQQVGNNNRSDISLSTQGASAVNQQFGSNLSNTVTQQGVPKAITVTQSR